jgi:peroxiredoxin
MLSLGAPAPDFSLKDTQGKTVSLKDFEEAQALLVIFMCNHCPYVQHIADELVRLTNEYQAKGVAVVGINANDAETHPDDAPEKMAEEVEKRGYSFSYLYDENQEVAKAYHAACTPDFFLFDGDKRLFYRGRLDASRPGTDIPLTGEELREALDAVLAGKEPPENQKPSMGCNIKWKPGNEPEYFEK